MARGRKKKTTPVENIVVPAMAGAAIVAGMGRGVIERARHNGRTDDGRDQRHERDQHEQPDAQPADKGLLDKVADKVPFLRTPIAVHQRFNELQGNHLAASVTLQAFLSLFPLLLVATAAVGFVAGGGTDVAGNVIENLGLTGDAASAVNDAVAAAEESRRAASVIGLAGLLWSGLGLISALQHAYDTVWQVEARGIKDKAIGLLWLVGAALLFVGSAAATTVLRWLPGILSPLGILVAFGVSLLLWIWTGKVLPNRPATIRMILPGAILGAVGLEVLKAIGAFYVPRLVASSSQLYGSIGIVFAILAWLLIFSRLVVYSAVLNVVLHERRAGTVQATVEVPRGVTTDATPEVDRTGRVEKEDAATAPAGR
jgi:membrane protein